VIPKALKHRLGIRARRVAVRPHVPGYMRWLGLAVTGTAAVVLLWLAYHYGQIFAGFEQHGVERALKKLATDNVQLEKANARLKSELAVIERQLQIERATYTDLVKQVKALSNENARLKEDVALMQTISAPGAKIEGVRVSSVRVEPNPVAGEYNYRIVLLQTGSRAKPFQGSYQLVVNLLQDGKRMGMTVPATGDRSANGYQLDFRVHQRIDGTFKVSPDAVVRSVQVRVFEDGQAQPKVMQTVTLS